MQTNPRPVYLNFRTWIPLQSPGTIYSLNSRLRLFCLPKACLPSEQTHRPPPFPCFKNYKLDHINPLHQLCCLSLLSPIVPSSLAVLVHACFPVSPRDRCPHWGEFHTTVLLLRMFSFLRPYTSCAQKASMSTATTILGHSQEGEALCMYQELGGYIHSLTKPCLTQIISFAAILKEGMLTQVEKVAALMHTNIYI